jgi:hypothetical protein
MSNFELYYLVIGPAAMLAIGAVVFFGGRWLILRGDQPWPRKTPAE